MERVRYGFDARHSRILIIIVQRVRLGDPPVTGLEVMEGVLAVLPIMVDIQLAEEAVQVQS